MNGLPSLDKCAPFIWTQCQSDGHSQPTDKPLSGMTVTISRQTGSGGHSIGRILARDLQAHNPAGAPRWSIFDSNLVRTILEEHRLPRHFARFMPEDRISELADTIDEFWGVHPPSWDLTQKAAETIRRLARQGNVILIGRGANVILRELSNVFHVRLVASLDRRVQRIQQLWGIEAKAALAFIRKEDLGRQRYLQKYFGKEIEDPLLYHLVINTDLVSYEQAARLIRDTVLSATARTAQIPSAHPPESQWATTDAPPRL